MYLLAKLATVLISPLGTALALAVVAMLLALFISGRKCVQCAAWGAAVLAFGWLWLWSTPAASGWLILKVEAGYVPQAIETVPQAQAIVLLSGGLRAPRPGYPMPDARSAVDRVWHAARLYNAGKAPLIVLTGGRVAAISTSSEAEAMKTLLLDFGVPESAMVLETNSRNTRENAKFTATLLQQRGVKRILLVTSAMHMRRALAHFRDEGLEVIPTATDFEEPSQEGFLRYLPGASALEVSARAMKEWVGQQLWD